MKHIKTVHNTKNRVSQIRFNLSWHSLDIPFKSADEFWLVIGLQHVDTKVAWISSDL